MSISRQPSISDLDLLVSFLSPETRQVFGRLFHVSVGTGCLDHPEAMHPWLEKQFGTIEGITCQKVVKITNMATLEGALFNELRASRPVDNRLRLGVEAAIIDEQKDDPLNDPLRHTPADLFGRAIGRYSVTGSNVAKYDGLHAIIVFDHHNPLHFDRERIIDYINTGWRWAQKAHEHDPNAKYFLFIWNCLWKAGATLHHGHAQVMLTKDMHYAKIESLRRAALHYRQQYGSNYFHDLFQVHQALGCGLEKDGVQVLAYLAPIKDKEVLLFGESLNLSLQERVYEVLACLRDRMGVTSFNLVLTMPPLAPVEESWEGFPVLVRVVDRGNPQSNASDIGAMELYAASVVTSDPFKVARELKTAILAPSEPAPQASPA